MVKPILAVQTSLVGGELVKSDLAILGVLLIQPLKIGMFLVEDFMVIVQKPLNVL